MYEEYGADMRTRDCVERSIIDMLERLERYLPKGCALPVTDIKRSARGAPPDHPRPRRDHSQQGHA